MYATCTALHIREDATRGAVEVEYAIAGQPALLHASVAMRSVSQLSDEQIPLGLLPGACSYQSHRIQMQPNDVLLIATDGILEAEDKAGDAFGYGRLEKLLSENIAAPLPMVFTKVVDQLKMSFQQTDDQTLLLIRFLA